MPDDFYGQDSFRRLARFSSGAKGVPAACSRWSAGFAESSTPRYAMVGFRLDQTLSEFGAVSRGVASAPSRPACHHRRAHGDSAHLMSVLDCSIPATKSCR